MMRAVSHRLCILTGRAYPKLAEEVANKLKIKTCNVEIRNFANGEIGCRISDSVRGSDVFVIQPHCGNVNDALLEQAIIIDAARRASANSVTAVCPFLGYARQDRKSDGREPITAKLVIDILAAAGANRIMSVDLHSGQTQGFFNGPFDHLIAMPTLVKYLGKNYNSKDLVIVSPDAGRVKSAERYSSELGSGIAIIHKNRSTKKVNSAEAKYLIGDVKGKVCVVIDDMIDTAGTICAAAEILAKNGAKAVHALATHGLLSDPAMERIENSAFSKVIVTNTLPQDHRKSKKLVVLSIAPMLADAIKASFMGNSVSKLFDGKNQI